MPLTTWADSAWWHVLTRCFAAAGRLYGIHHRQLARGAGAVPTGPGPRRQPRSHPWFPPRFPPAGTPTNGAVACVVGTEHHAGTQVGGGDRGRLRPEPDVEEEPQVSAQDDDAGAVPGQRDARRGAEVEEGHGHRRHDWLLRAQVGQPKRRDIGEAAAGGVLPGVPSTMLLSREEGLSAAIVERAPRLAL